VELDLCSGGGWGALALLWAFPHRIYRQAPTHKCKSKRKLKCLHFDASDRDLSSVIGPTLTKSEDLMQTQKCCAPSLFSCLSNYKLSLPLSFNLVTSQTEIRHYQASPSTYITTINNEEWTSWFNEGNPTLHRQKTGYINTNKAIALNLF